MKNQKQRHPQTVAMIDNLNEGVKVFTNYATNPLALMQDVVIEKNVENIHKLIEDYTNYASYLKEAEAELLKWMDFHRDVQDGNKPAIIDVTKIYTTQLKEAKADLEEILKLQTALFDQQNSAITSLASVDFQGVGHVATRVSNITQWLQAQITTTQKNLANTKKNLNDVKSNIRTMSAKTYAKNSVQGYQEQVATLTAEVEKLKLYIKVESDVISTVFPTIFKEEIVPKLLKAGLLDE